MLRTARSMEENHETPGHRVTEFDRLFQLGFQAVVESIVESSASWEPAAASDRAVVSLLETLTRPFLRLWIEHSRTLQLSSLEKINGSEQWQQLRTFIQRYGTDLFRAEFMTLANLRGVLHRGPEAYLDYLRDNPDPRRPMRLLDDLDRTLSREQAAGYLTQAIRAIVENYEEYKDFKTTTTQSDYGENLHVLLDFLRLKASYERHAWHFRPLVLAHEVLARADRSGAALLWQEGFTALAQDPAAQHLSELAKLEQTHALRLRTVRDRLEERFVKPLALDRLCVLVAPAMEAARRPNDDGRALARFQEELREQTATPSGIGLDVPFWLRRLQREVQRVRAERMAITGLTRKHFAAPRTMLALAEVRRQLTEWERPLESEE
jgi:hypothetical protein